MNVKDKIVVVTGGASGIGSAMVRRFHREGAQAVVVADLDSDGAVGVAQSVGGIGIGCDVGKEADVASLVNAVEQRFGRIDLYCSNAGVFLPDVDPFNAGSSPDESWMLGWSVNVMAHVYAARYALPCMIERGGGYFLNTVSAAGLLSQIGSAIYSTTKHAAIGFAENLAIMQRRQNIGVSVLCPQAVDTPMLGNASGSQNVDGVLMPDFVADCVVTGLEQESFLILPHEKVRTYMQRKTADYDRWIAGMARLRDDVTSGVKGSHLRADQEMS